MPSTKTRAKENFSMEGENTNSKKLLDFQDSLTYRNIFSGPKNRANIVSAPRLHASAMLLLPTRKLKGMPLIWFIIR
jgi:hypothetical protein